MTALYHDIDPFVCQWTENSIKAGVLAPGDVVCGDIRDLKPEDLTSYGQVHLFAGLGLWSYAARRANVRDSDRIWTASCPCPPFSAAGKKKACPECSGTNPVPCPRRTGFFICCLCGHAWFADERHLFPEVWRLARDSRPSTIYGEQVSSGDGRVWLASVRAAMDILGYDFGAEDTCLPRFGAPDIRQRLYWVADRADGDMAHSMQSGRAERRSIPWDGPPTSLRGTSELADSESFGRAGRAHDGDGRRRECSPRQSCASIGLADANGGDASERYIQRSGQHGLGEEDGRPGPGRPSNAYALNEPWRVVDWIFCTDGAWRPTRPGAQCLVTGRPGRIAALRAYGNAISWQAACAFIRSHREARADLAEARERDDAEA